MTKHNVPIKLFGLLFLSLISVLDVRARQAMPPTIHPDLLNAPVRSGSAASAPISLIRTILDVEHARRLATGTSSVYASNESDSLLVLRVDDLLIESVAIIGDSTFTPRWQVEGGTLTISLPEQSREDWRADIRFTVRSALHVASVEDRPAAIWSSSLPGRAGWLPVPADELSALDLHTTITVPEEWDIVLSGTPSDSTSFVLDGRRIARSSSEGSFPRASGFLTWALDANNPFAPRTEPTTDQALVTSFFDQQLGVSVAETLMVLTTDGQSVPVAFEQFAVLGTGGLPDDPWMRRYEQLFREVQLRITPLLGRLIPSDSWIEPALSSWIAVDIIRMQEGEAAAGKVLETLRNRYLRESTAYVRPLVWDRWNVASDLRDRHAEAKGAWVLRMLHERLGSEAFFDGMQQFLMIAEEEVVDSETLRESLETASREDLGEFFDVWVYSAGHPVVSLSYNFDSSTEETSMRLTQHQEGALVPSSFVFDVAFQYSTLAETNSVTIRVSDRERSTNIPTGIAPRFIHPDAFATVPLDFSEPPSRNDLVSQLRYSLDEGSTIRSLHLLEQATPDPSLLLGLRSAIGPDAQPAVLAEATSLLAGMAPSASALNQLLTWTSNPDGRVRSAAIRGLSHFPDASEAYDAALRMANEGKSAGELSAAVYTLVTLRPSSGWTVLRSALVTPSEGEQVRITALNLIGADTAPKKDLFDATRPFLTGGSDLSIAALNAIVRIDPNDRIVGRTLASWVKGDNALHRDAALSILEQSGDIRVDDDTLRQAAEVEPDPSLRRRMRGLLTEQPDSSQGR